MNLNVNYKSPNIEKPLVWSKKQSLS